MLHDPRRADQLGPNLDEYERMYRSFTWDTAWDLIDGLPGGRGLNIAHEAVDRHLAGPGADRIAVRRIRPDGRRDDLTYRELAGASSRVGNVFVALGLRPGDVVATLLGPSSEFHVVALGAMKARLVVAPLFSAYGPQPLRERLRLGGVKALVTTDRLYQRRIAPIREELPDLRHVLLVGDGAVDGAIDLGDAMAAASPDFDIAPTSADDPALLHFTSGTTGTPKGAVHVHEAVVMHHLTGRWALDLHDGDVYWCTADPGWVTGVSYGLIAPLTCGATCVIDESDIDAGHWFEVLSDEKVDVWYTAPTALRMLMRSGARPAPESDLSHLRFIGSVGEPLHPAEVLWGSDALGHPVHDSWWQTETGGIMISNFACCEIRPGSMGRPLPGIEAAVLARGDDGGVKTVDGRAVVAGEPDTEGHLAFRPGWPSMFRAYLGDEERYRASFVDGWYVSGDLVRRDADGWFWFVGRADDVIKSAGHLIGPTEIERTVMEHPAVVEAAAIGVPDPLLGERVRAYVVLRAGRAATTELARDILAFARRRLGPSVAPREIEFADQLPHTTSGKIVRRELRDRSTRPDGDRT